MSQSSSQEHDHSHDISKHVRTYWIIFLALLVGTAITVGMYFVHIDSVPMTIAVALFIATIKASLVACYFMHLISERKAVYAVLLSTVFFLASMMYLVIWARGQTPTGTEFSDHTHMPAAAAVLKH